MSMGPSIAITDYGVDYVEQALAEPVLGNPVFPADQRAAHREGDQFTGAARHGEQQSDWRVGGNHG